MLCLSYYCLFLLFNGTGEKHRTGSAWKWGGEGGGGGGGKVGEMTQTMYTHVSRWIKNSLLQKKERERDGTVKAWGQKTLRAIKLKIR
jgi:hypothetical protein